MLGICRDKKFGWGRVPFFWQQQWIIRHYFNWSTEWEINSGKQISFWFDSWAGIPLSAVFNRHHRLPCQKLSLREAANMLHVILPIPRQRNHQLASQTIQEHIFNSRCFAAIKNTHIFGTQKVGCYAASSLLELMEGKEWENFR
jgi:hypothetical protein